MAGGRFRSTLLPVVSANISRGFSSFWTTSLKRSASRARNIDWRSASLARGAALARISKRSESSQLAPAENSFRVHVVSGMDQIHHAGVVQFIKWTESESFDIVAKTADFKMSAPPDWW